MTAGLNRRRLATAVIVNRENRVFAIICTISGFCRPDQLTNSRLSGARTIHLVENRASVSARMRSKAKRDGSARQLFFAASC
jgi:hypothetical protein